MLFDFKAKIQSYLDRGESVQIVAPPGFGKSRFGRSLGGFFIDPNLLQSPTEILTSLRSSPVTKLVVLDSFDQLLSEEYQSVYRYIKALRDNNRNSLSVVFLVSKLLSPTLQPLLGDLFELTAEHIEYLPALDPSEYDLYGFTPSSAQLKTITHLSGGIPALVKIAVFSLRDNTPLPNPKLQAQIEEMLASSPDNPDYSKSKLIQDYLAARPQPLTASETRLLRLLESHRSQIVTKDQICDAVYPEVKNHSGITDHAIDQLIHRLRNKIKDQYSLTTHRGLGYKLS